MAVYKVFIVQPPVHAGSLLAEFYTLKTEAILSSETSVNTISTRRQSLCWYSSLADYRSRSSFLPIIRGWVGPKVGLDVVGKRKSLPLPDSNPGSPSRSP
jgi:hypothetical protein